VRGEAESKARKSRKKSRGANETLQKKDITHVGQKEKLKENSETPMYGKNLVGLHVARK